MHGAKQNDQNLLTVESCVASKALQAVACWIYMAHSLVLQAQQARTCLSMSIEEFCQSPPTLLCLLSLILACVHCPGT